ncbi:MAG: hypothetical protein WCF19_05835 [Chlamydiales bacterium]
MCSFLMIISPGNLPIQSKNHGHSTPAWRAKPAAIVKKMAPPKN